jgi:hypothetical protein
VDYGQIRCRDDKAGKRTSKNNRREIAVIERKTGRACRGRLILAAGSTLLMTAMAAMVTIGVTDAARADDNNAYGHSKWYVSASAAAGGNGSAAAPFNTLAQVQQASGQAIRSSLYRHH